MMGGEGVKTAACKLQKFELWLQPAELTDCWCDVYTRRCTGYRTRCTNFTVLDVCKERSEGCQPSTLGGINSATSYKKIVDRESLCNEKGFSRKALLILESTLF